MNTFLKIIDDNYQRISFRLVEKSDLDLLVTRHI